MTGTGARYLHLLRHGEAASEDGSLTTRGEEQARLVGRRLAALPVRAVHHGPLPRAVQTARLVGEGLPGVPVTPCEAVGDYVPPVPDLPALPAVFARFLAGVSPQEFAAGALLAGQALELFARPAEEDTHEVVVTHGFCVGWFVRHAFGAEDWRWLGLNAANCGLTTILYRPDRPPAVLVLNDQAHLPAELRWTGFPQQMRV